MSKESDFTPEQDRFLNEVIPWLGQIGDVFVRMGIDIVFLVSPADQPPEKPKLRLVKGEKQDDGISGGG